MISNGKVELLGLSVTRIGRRSGQTLVDIRSDVRTNFVAKLPLAIRSDFARFFQRANFYSFLSTFSVLPRYSQRTGREIYLPTPRILSSTFKKKTLIKFHKSSYICYIENVIMFIIGTKYVLLTAKCGKPITPFVFIFVMYKL